MVTDVRACPVRLGRDVDFEYSVFEFLSIRSANETRQNETDGRRKTDTVRRVFVEKENSG